MSYSLLRLFILTMLILHHSQLAAVSHKDDWFSNCATYIARIYRRLRRCWRTILFERDEKNITSWKPTWTSSDCSPCMASNRLMTDVAAVSASRTFTRSRPQVCWPPAIRPRLVRNIMTGERATPIVTNLRHHRRHFQRYRRPLPEVRGHMVVFGGVAFELEQWRAPSLEDRGKNVAIVIGMPISVNLYRSGVAVNFVWLRGWFRCLVLCHS